MNFWNFEISQSYDADYSNLFMSMVWRQNN